MTSDSSSPVPPGGRGATTSAWDTRVRELSRMSKHSLAALYGSRHTFVYLAAPLVRWSKDELISAVLEDEFPPTR